MATKEKRAYQRIDIKEKLKFGEDSPIHDGYSRNLSPDGMSIVSEYGLPANSSIKVRILRSSGDSIDLEGKVIWSSNPPGVNKLIGIKFTSSNEELISVYRFRSR
ncbi:MAG: PilZ domain-containing protein [Candidatus Dadabacteria bacterium]|nr:PilZ domain-containing protein [Candidatus Dadabacteria bacterium]NIS08482.1 PilZ domain-containing protein [Candidatus Dadabacteria bacterium]NIY21970.1 hypothetical protein [Candidatus Dadabacteria bacterium]